MNLEQRCLLNKKMQSLAEGDRSSFSAVYEVAWPVVRSFALRLLKG